MQECATVQECLPPLASAFCLPNGGIASVRWLDRILVAGEYAVTAIFPHVRDALAQSSGQQLEMRALQGVVGTGITFLDTVLLSADERGIDPALRTKLRSLLEEYQKLFEDIELFSDDILASDCLAALGAGCSGLESAKEDEAWRDL